MTPETDAMALEGIFRMLMPSFMGLVGGLFVVLVIFMVIRSFMRRAKMTEGLTEQEAKATLGWVSWTRNIIMLLMVAGFGFNALSMTAINRAPNAGLDGTAVYEQMQQNIDE